MITSLSQHTLLILSVILLALYVISYYTLCSNIWKNPIMYCKWSPFTLGFIMGLYFPFMLYNFTYKKIYSTYMKIGSQFLEVPALLYTYPMRIEYAGKIHSVDKITKEIIYKDLYRKGIDINCINNKIYGIPCTCMLFPSTGNLLYAGISSWNFIY